MPGGPAHTFQVYVHGRPVVEIFQSTSNIRQLKKRCHGCSFQALGKMLTSLSRLASGRATVKSAIVPCSIHSETITRAGGEFFVPTNGNRFGCLNCFHRTTSRKNSCPTLVSAHRVFAEQTVYKRSHLFQPGKVFRVDPQNLDHDLRASIRATPYICAATSPMSAVSNPPQPIGYRVRGW